MPFKVGIYGATGYTGLELARLLDGHPQTQITFVTSESSAGQSLRANWPQAPDLGCLADGLRDRNPPGRIRPPWSVSTDMGVRSRGRRAALTR